MGLMNLFKIVWKIFKRVGGARAVPVFHNSTKKELQHQFNQLDGILFPGGGSDLGPHTALFKSASFFYESAIQERKNGGYFTIFGHCMGFELVILMWWKMLFDWIDWRRGARFYFFRWIFRFVCVVFWHLMFSWIWLPAKILYCCDMLMPATFQCHSLHVRRCTTRACSKTLQTKSFTSSKTNLSLIIRIIMAYYRVNTNLVANWIVFVRVYYCWSVIFLKIFNFFVLFFLLPKSRWNSINQLWSCWNWICFDNWIKRFPYLWITMASRSIFYNFIF